MNLSHGAIARLQWSLLKKWKKFSYDYYPYWSGGFLYKCYDTLKISQNWDETFTLGMLHFSYGGRHNLYMFHMRWWLTQSICAALECVISTSLQLNQARRHQNMPSKCTLLFVSVLASVGKCISWICTFRVCPEPPKHSILIHNCSTCAPLPPWLDVTEWATLEPQRLGIRAVLRKLTRELIYIVRLLPTTSVNVGMLDKRPWFRNKTCL